MNILSEWENPNNYKQRLKTLEERFWEKVNRKSDSECWNWLGCKNRKGYGMVHFLGKMASTHRIAWILSFGEIQSGLFVLHHCDNPACVNPKHLFLGTNRDNIMDMHSKNRGNNVKGESHHYSKLVDTDIVAIRSLYNTGDYTYQKIGEMFGITRTNVMYIIKRKAWKHIL